MQKTGLSFNG